LTLPVPYWADSGKGAREGWERVREEEKGDRKLVLVL
jgi:hypothetical protein